LECKGWVFLISARLLLKAGKLALAEVQYEKLIELNPDHQDYLHGLVAAKELDGDLNSEKTERVIRLYKSLHAKYPHSHLIERMPLKYASGELFQEFLSSYLISKLRKGIPSLFNSITDLLDSPEKRNTIKTVVETFYQNLTEFGAFFKGDKRENPSVFLWLTYFLAQFYDYVGDIEKALEIIEVAIEHSPTAVELWMFKARILKHSGDYNASMLAMDEARSLDLQDRFLNSKCSKYMLRNNDVEAAEKTVALFARVIFIDVGGEHNRSKSGLIGNASYLVLVCCRNGLCEKKHVWAGTEAFQSN
jgi:peptide alpha-N-acetyltransferase